MALINWNCLIQIRVKMLSTDGRQIEEIYVGQLRQQEMLYGLLAVCRREKTW